MEHFVETLKRLIERKLLESGACGYSTGEQDKRMVQCHLDQIAEEIVDRHFGDN